MKNKKMLIIIGILLFLVFGFLFYKVSNIFIENNNNLEKLLENNNYIRAYTVIKDQNLLSDKNKDKTYKIINSKIKEYKITSVNDYLKLTDNDINNIKSFNEMIYKLQLYEDFSYLNKLVSIDDRFHDYIPAVRWYNSNNYTLYKENMKVDNLEDYEKSGKLMKDYSLKKYGLDNKIIKELDDEIKKYVSYCEKFSEFLKTRDEKFYNTFGNDFQNNLYQLNYLETSIKNKNADIEKIIKELPEI